MQTRFPRLLVVAAVATLLAPSAAATWYAYGSHEPDNVLDDATLMRVDPPGTAKDLIYFNVVTGMGTGARGMLTSPNVGTLETRIEVPTQESHQAIFGVWVDCNGDGYVGLAESALREYPAALLGSTDLCPPVTGSALRWTAGAHNYNGWVSELVPIAGTPFGITANTSDARVYQDPEAMVWGDYGRPTDPVAGGSCPLAPQPRGTYQSTGGFVNFVDCTTGLLERWNEVWTGRKLGGADVPGLNDLGLDLGLKFADDDNASGSWIDRPTLGKEDTKHSPAYVYDCDADRMRVGDTLNQTPVGPLAPGAVHSIELVAVDPRMGDTPPSEWSVAALVNHTIEGTNVSGVSIRASADCDTSNDRGADMYGNWATIYVGESDVNAVGNNKRAANFNFQFQYWPRGAGPLGIPTIPVPPGGPAGFTLPGLPMSNWNDGGVTTKLPATVRANIAEGTVAIAGAYYLSFYAHVGKATHDRSLLTPGGSGVYGSAQCASGLPAENGWNCVRAEWNRNADGSPVTSPTPLAAVGEAYEFRDVDCYDGAVGQTGIGLGFPYYGAQPCAPYV